MVKCKNGYVIWNQNLIEIIKTPQTCPPILPWLEVSCYTQSSDGDGEKCKTGSSYPCYYIYIEIDNIQLQRCAKYVGKILSFS